MRLAQARVRRRRERQDTARAPVSGAGCARVRRAGVFIAFEESAEELAQSMASLGFDLKGQIARRKLAVDYVYVERSEIKGTGEYDLEGLFIRLASATDSVDAKRLALDTGGCTIRAGFESHVTSTPCRSPDWETDSVGGG